MYIQKISPCMRKILLPIFNRKVEVKGMEIVRDKFGTHYILYLQSGKECFELSLSVGETEYTLGGVYYPEVTYTGVEATMTRKRVQQFAKPMYVPKQKLFCDGLVVGMDWLGYPNPGAQTCKSDLMTRDGGRYFTQVEFCNDDFQNGIITLHHGDATKGDIGYVTINMDLFKQV